MFGLTIPFAIEATRRNPVRTPKRNVAMSQGDDLILAIQVYNSDGTLVNTNFVDVFVTVQREAWGYPNGNCADFDYGLGWLTLAEPVVWSGRGTVVYGETGLATVTIPSAVTSNWWGRFRFTIALDGADAGCVTAEGVLDVRRCALRPIPIIPPVIGGDFASSDFATGDFSTGVVTPIGPSGNVTSDDAQLLLIAF